MVRHQLPLHGAGADEGSDSSPSPRASRSRNTRKPRRSAIRPAPCCVGPVTFLKLAKSKDAGFNPLSLLDRLLPVYIDVLRELAYRGAEWVQIDEPCLVLDLDDRRAAGAALRLYARSPKRCRSSRSCWRPISAGWAAIAIPRWRCPSPACISISCARLNRSTASPMFPKDRVLSLGIIDGRNIWRADLAGILDRLEPVVAKRGKERVQIAPSCSLLHVPIDLALETRPRSRGQELAGVLGAEDRGAGHARDGAGRWTRQRSRPACRPRTQAAAARKASPRIHDAKVARAHRRHR